jgi:hypothetical protein
MRPLQRLQELTPSVTLMRQDNSLVTKQRQERDRRGKREGDRDGQPDPRLG